MRGRGDEKGGGKGGARQRHNKTNRDAGRCVHIQACSRLMWDFITDEHHHLAGNFCQSHVTVEGSINPPCCALFHCVFVLFTLYYLMHINHKSVHHSATLFGKIFR